MLRNTKQRTTHFVDRKVQGALAKRVLMHWVMFLGTSIVCVTLMQVLLGDPTRSVFEHISAAASKYALFLIVLGSLLPAFVLDSVRLSNRFAGPVCRLRRAFREVAEGKPFEPVKFRGKDFWRELADDYNSMMECLAEKHGLKSSEVALHLAEATVEPDDSSERNDQSQSADAALDSHPSASPSLSVQA